MSALPKHWLSEFSSASVSPPSPLPESMLTSLTSYSPRARTQRHIEDGDLRLLSPLLGPGAVLRMCTGRYIISLTPHKATLAACFFTEETEV